VDGEQCDGDRDDGGQQTDGGEAHSCVYVLCV
jgi:hypothetical protein